MSNWKAEPTEFKVVDGKVTCEKVPVQKKVWVKGEGKVVSQGAAQEKAFEKMGFKLDEEATKKYNQKTV